MKNNDFEYRYVAPTASERLEIESIRDKYMKKGKSESKLEILRKLDNKVKNIPTAISLAIGIVGTLIFGLGIAMILEWSIIVWGVVVGIIGLIPTLLAYPAYLKSYKFYKNKYSKEILNLSDELLNDGNK